MASEYEKKFAEMKKYIPFLESMIKRLENSSTPNTNPRQAQLDKIRSLRDLLMDKNKRMKMENLLKCEQVLINLYSKVEQKVSVPKEKHESRANVGQKDHLDSARSKLKTLSSKNSKNTDTLPEIARASEIEEVCTPGSKEPALFQRRPYKHSPSPRSRLNAISPQKFAGKKNYTRVLVSPDSSPWRKSAKTLIKENTMFTRRSPRRSPKRLRSPVSERKKTFGKNKTKKLKDFNITLNVPEESLNSLNTKDILSRIINCSDGDVDITTLRELRTQILSELKQTGGNDDISDLILRSYKNKKTKETSKEEIEEGELSDSESETIENIYGSVVIVDKNKQLEVDKVSCKEENRKIQICLVINSTSEEKPKSENEQKVVDSSDFEIFSPSETEKKMLEERQKAISQQLKNIESVKDLKENVNSEIKSLSTDTVDNETSCSLVPNTSTENINVNQNRDIADFSNNDKKDGINKISFENIISSSTDATDQKVIETVYLNNELCNTSGDSLNTPSEQTFRANFYKPLNDDEKEGSDSKDNNINIPNQSIANILKTECENSPNQGIVNSLKVDNKEPKKVETSSMSPIMWTRDGSVEIPLLNEPKGKETNVEKDVVSQIDILQALKNEILGDTVNIQDSGVETPPLHQPKVMKVTKNADTILKKRISIEKYKEKSISSTLSSLNDNRLFISKEESSKKQSLKLTDKECERFQLPVKVSLDDSVSSEDEDNSEITADEVYEGLAPKSPDNEVDFNADKTQPVIIPVEPVKTIVEPSVLDIDMRKLPLLSPNPNSNNIMPSPRVSGSPLSINEKAGATDCRTKNDVSQIKTSSSVHSLNNDKQQVAYSNVLHTPSRTPNMTPNARTYEMTPNYTSFDLEDNNPGRKHVYASSFDFYERDYGAYNRKSRWSENCDTNSKPDDDFRSESYNYSKYNHSVQSTRYKGERRVESPRRSISSGRSDVSNVNRQDPSKTSVSIFSRLECPSTPSHPFGRLECPPTPVHYFGNIECPQTPSHPFGRPEPLLNVIHPFGRLECPPTPNAVFGRVDSPLTPPHTFGRSDCGANQSYPYKRSDGNVNQNTLYNRPEYMQKDSKKTFSKDPRLNRSQWPQESSSKYIDREHLPRDRNFSNERSYNPHRKSYHGSESYKFDREQSLGRNERNRYSTPIGDSRLSDYPRRESDFKESSRERENFYSRNRISRSYVPNSRAKSSDRESGPVFQREESFCQAHTSIDKVRETNGKAMSVKPQSGLSFVIDTSVNASFQDFMSKKGLQVYDLSFDCRRKRASSVGRDLGKISMGSQSRKELRDGRSTSPPSKLDKVNYSRTKQDQFRRASSVGRDIIARDNQKTFQEVKDDFQMFKNKIDLNKNSKSEVISTQKRKPKTIPDRIREKPKNSAVPYSPSKNRRDPRMRRNDNEFRNRMRIENRYKNTHGIVYSSDNIAKGAVLGSGYGVKNYKIPKIKRVVEENEAQDKGTISDITETIKGISEKEVSTTKVSNKIITSKEHKNSDSESNKSNRNNKLQLNKSEHREKGNKIDVVENEKKLSEKEAIRSKRGLKGSAYSKEYKISDSDDNTSNQETPIIEKRITRSRNRTTPFKQTELTNEVVKSKKPKKPLVYDSDSEVESADSGKQSEEVDQANNANGDKSDNLKEDNSNNSQNVTTELETEMFDIDSENITSDLVIASINAFIADSCNEIDTPKNEDPVDFSDDITFENMLHNIVNSDDLEDRSLDDIDEVIRKDLTTASESIEENSKTSVNNECENVESVNTISDDGPNTENTSNISDNNEQNVITSPNSIFPPFSTSEKVDDQRNKKDTPEQTSVIPDKDNQNSQGFSQLPSSQKVEEDLRTNESTCQGYSINSDENGKNVRTGQNDSFTQLPSIPKIEVQSNKENTLLGTLQDTDDTEDAIVSTTEVDKHISEKTKQDKVSQLIASDQDVCSTSNNSTSDVSDILKEQSLPDSTNELHNYESSDVSSSHNELMTKNLPGSDQLRKESDAPIDSIGSILTLLQDKSKIKQLLSMLDDDSAENEKIKKKLERISQIVSDEDSKEEECERKTKQNESIKCIEVLNPGESNQETTKNKFVQETDNLREKLDKEISQSNQGSENLKEESIENQPDHSVEEFQKEQTILRVQEPNQNMPDHCTDDSSNLEELTCIHTIKPSTNLNVAKENDEIQSVQMKHSEDTDDKTQNKETNVSSVINSEDILSNPLGSENISNENIMDISETNDKRNVPVSKKVVVKRGKRKVSRKWKSRKRVNKQPTPKTGTTKTKSKKPSRELLQLREDIKEIFSNDDVLNATGLRMCRLVKLVDEKQTVGNKDEEQVSKPALRKPKETKDEEHSVEKPVRKKPGPKPKIKILEKESKPNKVKLIAPKSKTKTVKKYENDDPYEFESDSVESSTVKDSDQESESNSDNSDSSSESFDNSEPLVVVKNKLTRKRSNIESPINQNLKTKKPKTEEKRLEVDVHIPVSEKDSYVIDNKCFTNKSYCFQSKVYTYVCRLCEYSGNNIVSHYKNQHPHNEIPLSRMDPLTTKRAIDQCSRINSEIIKQLETSKYICRFCSKEFGKSKENLERFFWHIVSMHTGEYKLPCSQCADEPCSFKLDIPPPPTRPTGQLIGYVCSKCNYTQLSLENLKTHVVWRHNDEHTDVFTVNLAMLSNKFFSDLLKQLASKQSEANINTNRVLRSTRSSQSSEASEKQENSLTEASLKLPHKSEATVKSTIKNKGYSKIQSKIRFEGEENVDSLEVKVKIEEDEIEEDPLKTQNISDVSPVIEQTARSTCSEVKLQSDLPVEDIVTTPHFKVSYKESGSKEYICCINGDNHYKTSLLISMKKHVQLKHSEKWDGFCSLCKVIVMPQGKHLFKECLHHFLDKHMDEFPVIEDVPDKSVAEISQSPTVHTDSPCSFDAPKPVINVRPLSQLMSSRDEDDNSKSPLPIIENVVSLGDKNVPLPQFSPKYPVKVIKEAPKLTIVLYEEWQAEIMSKKHRVVLEAMMDKGKLIKIYKCAGRFCSFTSDSVEEALMHASTHQRIGGENALCCAYCDFNTCNNGIDLVMHVFKSHGNCQYACALCFYRAAASQSVATHILKAHTEASVVGNILHTTNVSAIAEDSCSLLSREEAVAFYLCGHSEVISGVKTACNFRTYTAAKFYEHLQDQHCSPFSCGVCCTQFTNAPLLVQHMSDHDMGMYQCAWCVYGADSETQIMTHSSTKHPSKQPQAYLRVITNKDGTNGYRVLPLANMSQGKFKVATETVTPGPPEDPVREAERSLDLEKLIRHIDTIALLQPPPPPKSATNETCNETVTNSDENSQVTLEASNVLPSSNEDNNVQSKLPVIAKEMPEQKLLVPKKEPQDALTPKASTSSEVIYCFDSDEEDSSRAAVDTSPRRSSLESIQTHRVSTASNADSGAEEENYIKIPITELCRCPYCKVLFRGMAGFRKHAISCGINHLNRTVSCPHSNCTKMLNSVSEIISHFDVDHRLHPEGASRSFICGLCDEKFLTMSTVKKHLKVIHKVEKYAINVIKQGHMQVYTIRPHEETVKQTRTETKRKLSVDSNKMKRFGPQDINLLPINPILDSFVYCSLCEFSTKVRLNMVRHLQLHTEQQPVPQTEPVNPVPHLETNEKHFDKMVNLASSSVVTRTPDKPSRQDSVITIPVEAATRYPKYVPERQRYVCGAKGCTYISVDEDMLKRHWEALHPGCTDYRCAHCPPFQYLDTTKPLTSARIIGHLKMHEATLYACSSCSYYHFKRQILEKHLDQHKSAHIITVREESSMSNVVNTPVIAPTMDLKPWQCGLCQFKCMLRPEIVEHCFKMHQSKMQFKCSYCPYRTSDIENILKHQNNSHSSKEADVFYYFYREGSLPDDQDGTPRWQLQRDKMGLEEPEIKTEFGVSNVPTATLPPVLPQVPPLVDLKIVKKEIMDDVADEMASIDELCKIYGQFCEPNGIKYKCSLCKVVFEDTKEAMQSHLYEELKYRMWECGICSYKAFHKTGLNDHMFAEHRGSYYEPHQLPRNVNIEKWVHAHLEHQGNLIQHNKENLIKQKVLVPRAEPRPSTSNVDKPQQLEDANRKFTVQEIEEAFGSFCPPSDMQYRCPKCNCTLSEEAAMREHLETELSKIRWCCTKCSSHFQTYHEAQFHCKSHVGESARPKEAIRDPLMRKEWVSHIISTQKVFLHRSASAPTTSDDVNNAKESLETAENSLLVVRYEERVPTPDATLTRKRQAPVDSDDDEKLVIHEPKTVNKNQTKTCDYCSFTTRYFKDLRVHVLRHYGLKPFICGYCDFTGHKNTVVNHSEQLHPGQPLTLKSVPIPNKPPMIMSLKVYGKKNVEKNPKCICLQCEKYVPENEIETHFHSGIQGEFAKRGNVVVKCGICLALRLDLNSLQEHHNKNHADIPINYAFFRLNTDTRDSLYCGHCNKRFRYIMDLRSHHNAVHSNMSFKHTTSPNPQYEESEAVKRKASEDTVLPPPKRVAKKSTTKLPKTNAVARKSTTKLPNMNLDSDSSDSEQHFSYYGTKPPSAEDYANVTTMMPFCNSLMPFTVKKLREIIQVDPKVVLKDIRN